MPELYVSKDDWYDIIMSVFMFAEGHLDSKKIIVSCNAWYSKYYFRFSFKDTKFNRKDELTPYMSDIFKNIEKITNQYGIAESGDRDLQLVIEFYKK